jgi:hypothetical protein
MVCLDKRIANWFLVDGNYLPKFISMTAGTELTDVITPVSQDGENWTYKLSFAGLSGADATVVSPKPAGGPPNALKPDRAGPLAERGEGQNAGHHSDYLEWISDTTDDQLVRCGQSASLSDRVRNRHGHREQHRLRWGGRLRFQLATVFGPHGNAEDVTIVALLPDSDQASFVVDQSSTYSTWTYSCSLGRPSTVSRLWTPFDCNATPSWGRMGVRLQSG